ncbi:MAG: malto-oligosyltrehalose trehalohydrolase, partial [Actinomycetota bacterium]
MKPAVWAPIPRRVDLVEGDGTTAMAEIGAGWWGSTGDLEVGTDYAFSLDGGPPLPDPRSRHQPQGVHGPSRVETLP